MEQVEADPAESMTKEEAGVIMLEELIEKLAGEVEELHSRAKEIRNLLNLLPGKLGENFHNEMDFIRELERLHSDLTYMMQETDDDRAMDHVYEELLLGHDV